MTKHPGRFQPTKGVVRLYSQIEEQLQRTRRYQELIVDDVILASDADPGPAGDLYFLAVIRSVLSRCLIVLEPKRYGPTPARGRDSEEALAWLKSRSPKFAVILSQPEQYTMRSLLLTIKESIEPFMDTPNS